MRSRSQFIRGELKLLLIALGMFEGCASDGPSAIQIPSISTAAAADKALQLYDLDGSKSLSEVELVACPGIGASRERYDTNGDKEISRDEIVVRLQAILSSGVGLTPVVCRITSGGQPVADAAVQFMADPLLENGLKPAVGTTDPNGAAVMAISDEELPPDQRGLRSMQPGIYRIEIKHPRLKQPASPLGCEIDPTSRGGTEVVLRL
jgi:hypothetical protein